MKNKIIKYSLYICYSLFFYYGAKAQKKLGYDSTYISKYPNQLCITLVGSKSTSGIDVLNQNGPWKTISYLTNTTRSWGVGIDYKWITFELTHNLGFLFPHDESKGKSTYNSLNFGLTKQKWWLKTYIRHYKGMYWSNVEDLFPKYYSLFKDIPVRNDLENTIVYLGLNYSFNHKKYSHMASLWQLDTQKKSAGSFILGASLVAYGMKADSSILPGVFQNQFGVDATVKESVASNFIFSLGYVHTFVYRKKFFLHLSAIPGFAIQTNSSQLQNGDIKTYRSKLGIASEGTFSIGYNGPKYYVGFCSSSHFFTGNLESGGVLDFNYSYNRFFIGKRFNVDVFKLIKPTKKL